MIIANGQPITKHILSFTPGQNLATPLLTNGTQQQQIPQLFTPKSLDQHEIEIINNTLKHTRYNIKKTAEILNISRTTLYNKCRKFNINTDDE